MAQFTEVLQDVDTRFLSPSRGVVEEAYDGSASMLRFGELAGVATESFLGGRLENKMKDLKQEFLDEEVSYSPQELGAIEDATERFEAMKRMASQTGRNSEFKIRSEALMKEYINTMPGLATEFRRISASVLGFDPTGAELNEKMREIEEATIDSKKLMEQINNDGVSSFGMIPGEVYTKEGKQKYLMYQRTRERMNELDTLAKLQSMTEEEMDIQGELARNTWNIRTSIQGTANSAVLGALTSPEIGFHPDALQNGITSEMMASLSPDQRRGMMGILDQMEAQTLAEFQQYRQHFNRVEDYKSWEDQVLSPINQYRQVLNGELAAEDVEISQKHITAGMQQELLNHPWYLTAKIMSDVGIQLPDMETVEQFNSAIQVYETIYNRDPSRFTRNIEDLNAASVTPEVVGSVMNNFLVNHERAFGEGGTTEQQDVVMEGLVNFAEMMASDKGYSATTMRTFMESLSNPDNIEMFQQVNEEFPDVFLHVQRAASTFATQAARAATLRIDDVLERTSYGVMNEASWMEEFKNELVEPYVENGQVKLRLSEEMWSKYMRDQPPANNRGDARRRERQRSEIAAEIDKANRYALRDLNRSTKALSNLQGDPQEEQLAKLIANSPIGQRLGLQAPVRAPTPRSTPTPSSPIAPPEEAVGEAPEGTADGVYTDSNGNTVRVEGGMVYEL